MMKEEKAKIEFVNYDGEYPNLCSGVVTLKINDKIVEFTEYTSDSNKNGKPYLDLSPGGQCEFDDEGNDIVTQEPWDIDLDPRYAEFRNEILEVINNNIPWGCCGGCI